jgi:hypothetical protein
MNQRRLQAGVRCASCVVLTATLVECGGGSPTSPDLGPPIVALGPQVLRITVQSRCTLPLGVLPMLYTRVTVTRSGNGWLASASNAEAGEVQVRFEPSGGSAIPGTLRVAGTIIGTVVHMPELLPVPSGRARATFAPDVRSVLEGIAFTAGALNSTTGGLDGVGTGSFDVTPDAVDQSCTASSFSWSIFPPPQ